MLVIFCRRNVLKCGRIKNLVYLCPINKQTSMKNWIVETANLSNAEDLIQRTFCEMKTYLHLT